MKLYFSPGACSLAVRIIINELNLSCDYEAVDLKKKITASGKDFYQINPKGAVPVLVIENRRTLTENAVIQQYLADHHPQSNLLPPIGDFKRYRVLEWLNFVSTDLHKGCSPLFNAAIPENVKADVFRPALQAKLKYVEENLGEQAYLLGDHFTLPDAYLFVVLRWMKHLGIDLATYPNLTRYFQALSQRPSIAKSRTEEKL